MLALVFSGQPERLQILPGVSRWLMVIRSECRGRWYVFLVWMRLKRSRLVRLLRASIGPVALGSVTFCAMLLTVKKRAVSKVEQDRYGRSVARCEVAGVDLGRWLVQRGLAFAYRKYSMDYDLDEKRAAVNDRGLHASRVQNPADFRAAGAQRCAESPRLRLPDQRQHFLQRGADLPSARARTV